MSRFSSASKSIASGLALFIACLAVMIMLVLILAFKIVMNCCRILQTFIISTHKAIQKIKDKQSGDAGENMDSLLNTKDLNESASSTIEALPAQVHVSQQDEVAVTTESGTGIGGDHDNAEDLEVMLGDYPRLRDAYDHDINDPHVRPPYDYEELIEDFQNEFEEEEGPPITILILRRDEASNPNLPSQFFPGCGSDGAKFKVLGDQRPSTNDLTVDLYRWADDACLVNYDEETGIGYFRIVDGDAPEGGSEIILKREH